MSSLDSQVALIENYHDGLQVGSPGHDSKNCRVCFLLSEVQRWKAAHRNVANLKRGQQRLMRAIMNAVKEQGWSVKVSRSTKTITVKFCKE